MTAAVVANGYIYAGTLKLHKPKVFAASLRKWKDGEVSIRVEKRHATRSLNQNAWYWSQVVGLVAEHTGYTADEVHEFYKAKFLPRTMNFQNGNGEVVAEFITGGTTTHLNKIEFGEYCEQIREWAASTLDVVIPNPGERVAA